MCFIIFPIILFSCGGADIFEPQNMPIRKQFVSMSFETVFAIGFDQIGHEKSQQTQHFSRKFIGIGFYFICLFVKYQCL